MLFDRRALLMGVGVTLAGVGGPVRAWPMRGPRTTPLRAQSDSIAGTVDAYFRRAEACGFAGSVVVAAGDRTILRSGYGDADWRSGAAATPETAFDIASLDKQFIATGILKLEAAGKLRLDDPVARFYPAAAGPAAPITLHQLLSHTSGLDDIYWDQHPELSRDQFIDFMLYQSQAVARPGEAFSYASANYWILEGVIERASGDEYESYLRKTLFLPAGMNSTGTTLPAWRPRQVARLRRWTSGDWPLAGIDYGDILHRPAPYRTLLSTADDLLRWRGILREARLVPTAMQDKLFRPNLESYGYGWRIVGTRRRGARLIEHGGSDSGAGMRSTFRYYPEDDVFFALLGGSVDPNFTADYMAADVAATIFGGDVALPAAPTPPSPAANLRAAGTYAFDNGAGAFHLEERPGGRLLLSTEAPQAAGLLRFPALAGADQSATDPLAGALREIMTGNDEPFRQMSGRKAISADMKAYLNELRGHGRAFGPISRVVFLHDRPYDREGTPEIQSYYGLVFGNGSAVFRLVRTANAPLALDARPVPTSFATIVAPIGMRAWQAWDFVLGRPACRLSGDLDGALMVADGAIQLRAAPAA